MPSLYGKNEKIVSNEAPDWVKQILNMVEKKNRNLEKRKSKLDNYRLDVENGKELNEDQKIAVSKYETVVTVLEAQKDFAKSINSIILENSRQQKKLAKKEQLERQQHEIQRLQEAFMYLHILSCFQNEEVRNDFLNGENGAVQLTSEQLSQLDQLYKLIGPGLPTERADLSNHFHALAENHIFLVEGKNKEIIGSTYKVLKDLLQSIKESGYFSRPSGPIEEDGTSSEDMPEDNVTSKEDQNQEALIPANIEVEQSQSDEPVSDDNSPPMSAPPEEVPCLDSNHLNSGPLQEVLASQSAFNFLQESQIDLGAPHMDPAVVAVHQMAPPPPNTVNFAGGSFSAAPQVEDNSVIRECEIPNQPPGLSQIPIISSTVPCTVAPVLSSVHSVDFDPSHPIPTQTFTNQSFAVMQNIMMPQGYVPVTMHHPTHITPIAVVSGLSTPVTSAPSVVPIPVSVAPGPVPPNVDNCQDEMEPKNGEIEKSCDITPVGENESSSNHGSNEKNGENGYAPPFRGGYRGRGRGRGNGYYKGRSNYNGRGYQHYDRNGYHQDRNSYQDRNMYQDRNNYEKYRRSNNRGPRGGNNRGRGNYRTQGSSATHQQQQTSQ